MSQENTLDKIKRLREITGVGFKDCKSAIDENNGDIDKSIEYLRKKGIAKASKKMTRIAADGLVCINEKDNKFSIIEINSETDFVAKNNEFINFGEEVSALLLTNSGDLEKTLNSKMKSNKNVKDSLVDLISKIGEKITIRRTNFFENKNGLNFFYVHSAIENNIGKIISIVQLDGIVKGKNEDIGNKIAMHIAASNPLAIEKNGIKKEIIDKELEIIKAEITNSGKPSDMAEKISKGKIAKFINDNTLLNQIWIMDPKKKVSDILKENKIENEIKILNFVRYKVGEGI